MAAVLEVNSGRGDAFDMSILEMTLKKLSVLRDCNG